MARRTILIATLLAAVAAAGVAPADPPPGLVNYQGLLTDGVSGLPLQGSHDLAFAVYADSLPGGDPLWQQTHHGVPVVDGLFNVILGADGGGGSLTAVLFAGSERWLGIAVDGDAEMAPRQRITSVPYALRAAVADSVAGGGGGAGDGHSLDAVDGSPVDALYVDADGEVGIGTTAPHRLLEINNGNSANGLRVAYGPAYSSLLGEFLHAGSGGLIINSYAGGGSWADISLQTNSTTRVFVNQVGKVGIGTTAPAEYLDVVGTVQTQGFKMPTGAGSGWVLTSDASGVGTWQPSGGGTGDGDWIIVGSDMYAAPSGFVGVGTDAPGAKLDVVGDGRVLRVTAEGSRPAIEGRHDQSGTYGYVGTSDYGVEGQGGALVGVYGASDSVAVYGFNSGTLRTTGYLAGQRGVYGESAEGNYGYLGGGSFAVYGAETTSGNYGGIGYWLYGVLGDSESQTGVVGRSVGGTGVAGETTSGWGVKGEHLSSGSYAYLATDSSAVEGHVSGQQYYALAGRNTASGNRGHIGGRYNGVYGESSSGNAVSGVSPYGNAVRGVSEYGNAGYFEGDVVISGGQVTTPVIEITGGSDLSEQFAIHPAAGGASPEPGFLVCVDPARPGDLVVSERAYDKRVAGVISGAGGIRTGMLMGQRGTVADGADPVALTGRVYCWADAAGGPIEPGDLLTTSDRAGHAMKAADRGRSHGTVIGKAMTALPRGRGLVLVLVNLQ